MSDISKIMGSPTTLVIGADRALSAAEKKTPVGQGACRLGLPLDDLGAGAERGDYEPSEDPWALPDSAWARGRPMTSVHAVHPSALMDALLRPFPDGTPVPSSLQYTIEGPTTYKTKTPAND